jgi:hypothetical protein
MEQKRITKTCINCGLQKPITAFLQITGAEGTSYGSICSTCRGSGMGKVVVITTPDEESGSSTGMGNRIDAKAKAHIDATNKNEEEKQKVSDKEEREKLEDGVDEHLERKEMKHAAERRHREEFLETKKQDSFLNFQPKNPAAITEVKKAAQVKQIQIETVNKEESQKKDIHFDNIDLELAIPGEKLKSATFLQAKQWLGTDAPNRKFLSKPTDSKTDPVVHFVEKNFENEPKNPGTRRR